MNGGMSAFGTKQTSVCVAEWLLSEVKRGLFPDNCSAKILAALGEAPFNEK